MKALRDFLLEPAPGRAPTAPQAAPAGTFAGDAAAAHSAAWDAAPATAAARDLTTGAALARPRAAALPPGVALLCPPAHARALGAAVALLLVRRARGRARTGLVVVWAQPHGARPAPAVGAGRAARRLAATLTGRGLDAHATGRLAFVVVPADPVQAVAAAARAIAAAGAAPSVLALGRRDARFDALVGEQDRVLVTAPPGADAALHRLAVAGLASVAGDVRACGAEPSPLARAVAASGLWVPATLRRPLGEVLRGLAP